MKTTNMKLFGALCALSLIVMSQARTCCDTDDTSSNPNDNKCERTVIAVAGIDCVSCRKDRTTAGEAWSDVRSCSTTRQTTGCTIVGDVETCFCNDELCNGVSGLTISGLAFVMCILRKYII